MGSLEGKVAINNGAGRGIGQARDRRFAAEGAKLRSAPASDTVRARLSASSATKLRSSRPRQGHRGFRNGRYRREQRIRA